MPKALSQLHDNFYHRTINRGNSTGNTALSNGYSVLNIP
jgi:hypothetical protein